ncbi:MAG: DUF1080 domain-containing protein [Verrucomicrobia bacterium]|nr:DUF1080 domain-containing protein [Verrucomicrobiota bacterium]
MIRHLSIFALLNFLICFPLLILGAGDEKEFDSIFDGLSLSDWHVVPEESSSDWSVVNHTIQGKGSEKRHSYLLYDDAKLKDFELKFTYRLPGEGNTGVSIRMRPDTTGKRAFESYHADLGHVGIGPHILGAWDFHFATRKEHPCNRGTSLVIEPDGSTRHDIIPGALRLDQINAHQWNEVHIIARGNHFQFFINGKLASEVTDNFKDSFKQGSIALQIHEKGMIVDFKDLRLKRL